MGMDLSTMTICTLREYVSERLSRRGERPQAQRPVRPRGIEWVLQGLLGFIAFTATVVFGSGAIRWLGLAASLLLVAVLRYARCCCSDRRQPAQRRD